MTDHTAHRTGWRITTCAACAAEYADPLRPADTDQDLTDGAKHAIGVYLAVSGLLLALALPLLVLFAALWRTR